MVRNFEKFKMNNEQETFLQTSPSVVCIFSGKRKSGKDFVVEKLKNHIGGDRCAVLRLSGPLKQEYARIHELDFNKLLDASCYKEKYRKDMIKWGEDKRNQDPTYFCNLAAKQTCTQDSTGNPITKPFWFVSDARRITDIQYFKANYANVLHVRVEASIATREARGWVFTARVDDAESECGLDDETYDFVIGNDDDDDNQLMDTLKLLWIKMQSLKIDLL